MNRIKLDNVTLFLLINGLLCLFYMIIFEPIVFEALGDAPAYIDLAKQIYHLPGAPLRDLSYRSPLYSIILGFFMLVFGQTNFVMPIIIFQYLMVFFTGWFVYRIVFIISESSRLAFIGGILSTINLSTVFFAYLIATETLSIFLFSFTVLQFLKYLKDNRIRYLVFSGLASGLLVLARFNAIGVPVVLIFLLITYFVIDFDKKMFKKYGYQLLMILLPILFVLNSWAFYNFIDNGFYNVIPSHHTGQRWAIPSTINQKNKVSEAYSDVLSIFLKNVEVLKMTKKESLNRKGSLLNNPIISRVNDYFNPVVNGYYLYKMSEKELLAYYKLPDNSEGVNQLGNKLAPFYIEIAEQNYSELFKLRIYSFLYTFKSNSPVLPSNENENLNRLPSIVLSLYKIGFIFIMIISFSISVVHLVKIIFKKKVRNSIIWITVYGMIWYFPFINFYANVLSDANRFKYPLESLVMGIFVIYFAKFINRVRKKSNLNLVK